MNRLLAILVIAAAIAVHGRAQDAIDPGATADGDNSAIETEPSRTVTAAIEQGGGSGPVVGVSGDACLHAVRHVPDADVEYRPGEDGQGGTVAPADLPGPALSFPKSVPVPITYDFARALRLPRGFQQKAYLGEVTEEDGRLTYNGEPLDDEAEADLAVACRQVLSRSKAAVR